MFTTKERSRGERFFAPTLNLRVLDVFVVSFDPNYNAFNSPM